MLGTLEQGFLAHKFLGTSLGTWLIALGVWALIALALVSIRSLLLHRLETVSEKRGLVRAEEILRDALSSTLKSVLIVVALYAALATTGIAGSATRTVGQILIIVLLLQIGRWGSRLIKLAVERYGKNHPRTPVSATRAVGFVARLVLYAFVALLTLENLGVDITALVTGLGIGGVAIALALQNILGDIFAYLTIIFDEPFSTGDYLVVGNQMGTVEKIGVRTTRVRSLTGEQIIFPNGDLLGSRIHNYKQMRERRILFTIGVLYETPHEKLAKIPSLIREIIEEQDKTRFDRAHFKGFGDSDLTFEAVYHVLSPQYAVYMDIQQAINWGISKRFAEEGIGFPYPTRTLYLNTPTPPGNVVNEPPAS